MHFGDRHTDEQMDSIDALRRTCCRKRCLNKDFLAKLPQHMHKIYYISISVRHPTLDSNSAHRISSKSEVLANLILSSWLIFHFDDAKCTIIISTSGQKSVQI